MGLYVFYSQRAFIKMCRLGMSTNQVTIICRYNNDLYFFLLLLLLLKRLKLEFD